MRRVLAIACVLVPCLVLGPEPAGATFPGANGRIAFYVYNGDPSQIGTIDPDGTDRVRFTNSTRRRSYNPSWSPDGSMLAFVTAGRGPDHLLAADADGTGQTVVFQSRRWGHLADPAWSPDGTQIAIAASGRGGSGKIGIVNVDGSGFSIIDSHAYRFAPDWSPDGARIAFVQLGPTKSIIKTMAPDGTDVTSVTEGTAPSWAPDGTQIAFFGGGRNNDIFVVAPDGSGRTPLTNTPKRHEFTPAFSPDGSQIAFSRTIGPDIYATDDIWIMDANGTDAVRITDTPRIDEFDLSWQSV